MSSGSRVAHSPPAPSWCSTRTWTWTSVTDGSSRQVTPTEEKGSVCSRDTVSAGTPGISSPDAGTSSSTGPVDVAGAALAGASVVGADSTDGVGSDDGAAVAGSVVGAAVPDASASETPPGATVPSVATTASPSGSTTEPRATSSMEVSTGCGSGAGAA